MGGWDMNKMKTILIIVTLIILLIIGFVSFDVLKHIRFKGQISGTLLEPNYPGGLLSPNNDQSLNTTDSVTFGTLDISGTTTLATTNGNVGIGTTNPDTKLHIQDTSSTTLTIASSSLSGCIKMGDSDGGGFSYITILNGTITATTTKPSVCK
jgi:hypothetical protein